MYSARPILATAQAVMNAARGAGVEDDDILLVARSDIELDEIPNDRKEADTDLHSRRASRRRLRRRRGIAGGPGGGGADADRPDAGRRRGRGRGRRAVGCWASALVGSSLPDPIRRKFDAEIQAGRILVVLDGNKEFLDRIEPSLIARGRDAAAVRVDQGDGLSDIRAVRAPTRSSPAAATGFFMPSACDSCACSACTFAT